MIFLPVVERELRLAARKSGTYWGRVWMALAGLLIWVWAVAIEPSWLAVSRGGSGLFYLLSSLAFGFALFAGLRSTSDSLSSEKREGTLGLLFLTDLKGYDVVLGKLTATSLGAFYGLLAVLPVLAIPLLLGGVTAAGFWRVVLVLLNTLFFSLASGMFVSAISRHERKAMGGTLLIVLFVAGGLPLIGFGVGEATGKAIPPGFFLPSPGFALFLASTSSALPVWRSAEFWGSLVTTHLWSWGFLMLAGWIAPYSWKDKPASRKRLRWREWWRKLILGAPERRRAFRARLLEINPIFWLSSRERQTASYPWIFLGSMAVIWILPWISGENLLLEPGAALFLTFGLHAFFKYWVLTLACNSFAVERDNGALELLLSTPLSVPELLRGQWLALRRQFALPITSIVVCDLLWLGVGLTAKRIPGEISDSFWIAAFLANVGMFAVDLWALIWVGMWMGVSSKTAGAAVFSSMTRILLLPWLAAALVNLILFLTGMLFLAGTALEVEYVIVLVWFLIGLGIDCVYGWRAHLNLHNDLRRVATQRFSGGAPPSR